LLDHLAGFAGSYVLLVFRLLGNDMTVVLLSIQLSIDSDIVRHPEG